MLARVSSQPLESQPEFNWTGHKINWTDFRGGTGEIPAEANSTVAFAEPAVKAETLGMPRTILLLLVSLAAVKVISISLICGRAAVHCESPSGLGPGFRAAERHTLR